MAAMTLSCGAVVEYAQTAPVQAQPRVPDLTTLEATIRSYVGALNKGAFKLAAMCVAGTHLQGKLPAALQESQRGFAPNKVHYAIKNLRVTKTGSNAHATMQNQLLGMSFFGGPSHAETLNLRRAQGVWKIAVSPGASVNIMSSTQMMENMAAGLLHPAAFIAARAEARGKSCVSNLRQLSIGAAQLAADNDDKFVFKTAPLQKTLMPYVMSEAIFICLEDAHSPALQGRKKVSLSYAFNTHLEGVALKNIKHPATTVLIYEGKAGKLNFRHNSRAAVTFVDNSGRLVNAQQAKALIWKP